MPRTKPLLSTLLAIAGAGAFLYGSHWIGSRVARAGLISSARPSTPSSSAGSAPERPRPAPNRGKVLGADVKKRFYALAATSLDLRLDWETRIALRKILAGLSAEELADLYAGLPLPRNEDLAAMIGGTWAELDPTAAFKAVLANAHLEFATERDPRAAGPVRYLFEEWAGNQPAAALAWLESPDLPPELAGMKDSLYQAAVYNLIEKDFDVASQSVLKMSRGAADEILHHWGGAYSSDPGVRDQLVEFAKSTGRPQDYATLNAGLLSTWPQDDSVGMMNYLIGLKDYLEGGTVPAEARPQVDATAVGAAIGREYDRPALEWWMERYSGSADLPDPLAKAFTAWQNKAPDKVDQWLAEQPPSLQLDAIQAVLAPTLADRGNFPKAAERIGSIADPTLRQQAADKVNSQWTSRDPAAAAAWRATLPANFPAEPK